MNFQRSPAAGKWSAEYLTAWLKTNVPQLTNDELTTFLNHLTDNHLLPLEELETE